MPRYFFDIHGGSLHPDEEGTECENFEAARKEALTSLPEVSRWEIPADGDNQSFTVVVRDESGKIVYLGKLTYAGLKLSTDAV